MARSFGRLAFACLGGGLAGAFVGHVLGIVCSAGPCAAIDPGLPWAGAAVGAGVTAWAVLAERPDPRACNRQDPPFDD